MKRPFTLITFILGILFMIYILVFGTPFQFLVDNQVNKSRCKDEKRAFDEHIIGVLKNKYRDKDNHLIETIEYTYGQDKEATSLIFANEWGPVFDSLKIGDSIEKFPESLEIKITRNNIEKTYQLNFGCDKNK